MTCWSVSRNWIMWLRERVRSVPAVCAEEVGVFVRQIHKLAQPVTDSSLRFYRWLIVCAADAELLQLSKTTIVHTVIPPCPLAVISQQWVYRSIKDFHLHAGQVREINSLDSLDLAKLKHCILLKLQHFRTNKPVLYSYRRMSP